MAAQTFETSNTSGLPHEERHLPSAITRRLIVKLAPNKDAFGNLTLEGATTFNRVLHDGTDPQHETSRVVAKDGNYWLDFPYHHPVQAAEHLAEILFRHSCEDFADAELDEARIEPTPDSLQGVPIPEAWDKMQNVTKLVSKVMHWKQEQLLKADSANHLIFGVAEVEEPSRADIPNVPSFAETTLPTISIPNIP